MDRCIDILNRLREIKVTIAVLVSTQNFRCLTSKQDCSNLNGSPTKFYQKLEENHQALEAGKQSESRQRMSLVESSYTPTNEVEEDEAIDIDSCSEKSLQNIDEDAVVIPNEEKVTKKPSKVGCKRKSEVWQWFKTVEVNVKRPKGTMVKMNKAECTKCHKKYGVNSTGGTSHLLKDIDHCHEIVYTQ